MRNLSVPAVKKWLRDRMLNMCFCLQASTTGHPETPFYGCVFLKSVNFSNPNREPTELSVKRDWQLFVTSKINLPWNMPAANILWFIFPHPLLLQKLFAELCWQNDDLLTQCKHLERRFSTGLLLMVPRKKWGLRSFESKTSIRWMIRVHWSK